jgi:hypothetical protein
MKKKTTLVMIPTEDRTDINKMYPGKPYGYTQMITRDGFTEEDVESQHLYATVSQYIEPVSGCWYYDNTNNKIEYCKKGHGWGKDINLSQYSKIIATTDRKLTIETDLCNRTDVLYDNKIPQLQQSTVKQFVDNPNGVFEVDYEYFTSGRISVLDKILKLKLNQDNTVNIRMIASLGVFEPTRMDVESLKSFNKTSIKKKMYSKEQMLNLMDNYQDYLFKTDKPVMSMRDWIKENL